MRLITWNCHGAFRKKADLILAYLPDILVVQECENLDKLKFSLTTQKPNDRYWYGDSVHRGLGLFSYSDYKFELLPEHNPTFRYILPFRVTGYGQTFTLLAIWAMNNKENHDARYIGQIWLAINYYKDLLGDSTILIGDFNSSKIWDYKARAGNHSDVVNKLADQGIQSIYHNLFDIEQGKEIDPTFFLHKNVSKPYHIDYVFGSERFLKSTTSLTIGKADQWIKLSDHMPIIIEMEMSSYKMD